MMPKSYILSALASLLLATTPISLVPTPASASTAYSGTLFSHTDYDYAPAIIDSGSTRKIWWCSYGVPPGWNHGADVIYYRTQNLSTGAFSSIQMVFWPQVGSWDSVFTCDPTVVSGDFVDPNTSTHYSMAMYYAATDDAANGFNNRVGVAFSNDGVSWVRPTSSPVISPGGSASSLYGAGNPSAYNSNSSGSSIRLFFFDNTTGSGNRVFNATSSDGISFGTHAIVQNSGLGTGVSGSAESMREADFAWDPSNSYWYAAIPSDAQVRSGEATSYSFGIFRTTNISSGSWEPVGWVSTDTTGNDLNHNPALVRNAYGDISSTSSIGVGFGTGPNLPTNWDLAVATITPGANSTFSEYYDAVSGDHWTTTGYYPSSNHSYQAYLGMMLPVRTAGTRALYSCLAGADQFISYVETCEGQKTLGIAGYAYTTQVAGTHPIYRCYTGADNFIALNSNCDSGFTLIAILGYLP